MSRLGWITSFDASTGYRHISPVDGSPHVRVDADSLAEDAEEIEPGTLVRFSSLQGRHCEKAYNVMILAPREAEPNTSTTSNAQFSRNSKAEAESGWAANRHKYQTEVITLLLAQLPSLTPSQIAEVGNQLANDAARRGWVA